MLRVQAFQLRVLLKLMLCVVLPYVTGCLEASMRRTSDAPQAPVGQAVPKASMAEVMQATEDPGGAENATHRQRAKQTAPRQANPRQADPRQTATGHAVQESVAGQPKNVKAAGGADFEAARSNENLTNRERVGRAMRSTWDTISTSATGVAQKIKSSFSNDDENEDNSEEPVVGDGASETGSSAMGGSTVGQPRGGQPRGGQPRVDRSTMGEAGAGMLKTGAFERGGPAAGEALSHRHWRALLGRVERLEIQLRQQQNQALNHKADTQSSEKLIALQEAVLQLEQRLRVLEADGTDIDGTGADSTEMNGAGANGTGANGTGANGAGANGAGADVDAAGRDGVRTDDAGSDEARRSGGRGASEARAQKIKTAPKNKTAQKNKMDHKNNAAQRGVKKSRLSKRATKKPANKKTQQVKKASKKIGNFVGAQRAFDQQKWRQAIQGYEKYRTLNPRGKQYALATYKMGVSFENLGLRKEAKVFYQEVMRKYPRSRLSSKVKFRLSRL